MNESLKKRIDAFLSIKKETIGTGWPEVTEEEVEEIYNILNDLIEAKYERDVDGDLPIGFTVTDKTRYRIFDATIKLRPTLADLHCLAVHINEVSHVLAQKIESGSALALTEKS